MKNPIRLFLILVCAAGVSLRAEGNADSGIDFVKDIQPILEFNCVKCHHEAKVKGGLRFDQAALFFEGGDGGPALVKGEPDNSLMIEMVELPSDDMDVMPPEGRTLHDHEIAKLRQWIKEGASWPEELLLTARNEDDFKGAEPLADNGKKIVKIEAFPQDINLEKKRDTQSVVVMATYDDDTTLDVTANATFTFGDPSLIALKTRNHFIPVKDGKTELSIKVADKSVKLPVSVTQAAEDRPISFNLDVMPVFMREGCNTGACHGSARGQDGFMLSLFGYDPDGDHFRLTRELAGYRINLAIPEESLLVEKSIEAVPHTGGKLMEKGGHGYNTMVEWIADGATNDDPKNLPTVVALEVYPPKLVLEGSGAQQQLTIRAKYSDGHDRDVTHLASFVTNNEPTAAVDEFGKITAGKRGEAFIMARYETKTVGIQTIVIPEGLDYTRPEMTENNYIDGFVHDKLHKLRMVPSGQCSDDEFLRRVSLDIVGQLPTVEEYHSFVADKDPKKREKLVDQLLERKEFTEMWVMKWSELLQIRSDQNINLGISYKSALLYNGWLRDQIAANEPLNEWVIDLISSEGGTFSNPATNFYQVERDSLKLSENVAQVFMGMRLQCAQCHNHPFDRWTMDDYYSWAAFFSQIGRKQGVDQREQIVYNRGSGEVKHLIGGKSMAPKFLGGDVPDVKGKDRREVLAEWLASPDNPYFASNIVNIVWSHFLGVGIIDPVDDVRVSNPASNPELLHALASRFEGEYGYDFKQLVRDICNSATYQRTTKATPSNKDDMNNFARARVRRQRAEVMLDTITQVTVTQNKFKGLPLGSRAVQIADGQTTDYFLTTFGRATRETVCSCEVVMDPSLSQALHLLNGPTVTSKIEKGKVVKSLLAAGKKPEEVIDDLYIRSFTRKPTAEEKKQLMAQVNAVGEDKAQIELVLNDVFWAVLNSKEFMFNH
ncbi:MAG: PSD1 and planctomycete cytochrome C domain-containing protein [Verrucomicrobiales bacterium]|nr:PSD1 and planctomycete cytochrome C domain-containing protein [Verrucomicrobiales bacterium]